MRLTRPLEGKNNMDEYYVYLARVVGPQRAHNKKHNSFSIYGSKNVAHTITLSDVRFMQHLENVRIQTLSQIHLR